MGAVSFQLCRRSMYGKLAVERLPMSPTEALLGNVLSGMAHGCATSKTNGNGNKTVCSFPDDWRSSGTQRNIQYSQL